VVESISNIRTVAGLTREHSFVKRYIELITVPHKSYQKRTPVRGAVFGLAQAVPFFSYATCMYYGGYLVDKEGLEYAKVFRYMSGDYHTFYAVFNWSRNTMSPLYFLVATTNSSLFFVNMQLLFYHDIFQPIETNVLSGTLFCCAQTDFLTTTHSRQSATDIWSTTHSTARLTF
jgi:hypothetical protein